MLGNNKTCDTRCWNIRLKMHDNTEKVLQEVRYVPELKRNIISLGDLDQSGHSLKADKRILIVFKGYLVIMIGNMTNGLMC